MTDITKDSATAEPSADKATSEQATPQPQQATPVHRQADFMASVEQLIKGKTEPKNDVSKSLVEDLREAAAQQDELRKRLQQVSEAAQAAQGAMAQSQGRVDALLQVLHRLETAA